MIILQTINPPPQLCRSERFPGDHIRLYCITGCCRSMYRITILTIPPAINVQCPVSLPPVTPGVWPGKITKCLQLPLLTFIRWIQCKNNLLSRPYHLLRCHVTPQLKRQCPLPCPASLSPTATDCRFSPPMPCCHCVIPDDIADTAGSQTNHWLLSLHHQNRAR